MEEENSCNTLSDAINLSRQGKVFRVSPDLAIECFDKSRKGQPLLPLNSLADFSVLYCGASPNAHAPRQIRSVSPFKDAGEWGSRPAGQRYQGFTKVVGLKLIVALLWIIIGVLCSHMRFL